MKNSSQLITIILSILFFGYIFYNYEPMEKTVKPIKTNNDAAYGLWGHWESGNIKEEFTDLEISNKGELDLIINMIKEYNQMNASNLSSFFADSCYFYDLSGNRVSKGLSKIGGNGSEKMKISLIPCVRLTPEQFS